MAFTWLCSPASNLNDICFLKWYIIASWSESCCLSKHFIFFFFVRLLLFLTTKMFRCSHYASCLEYLENLKPNLLLDIHLHDHVETLYTQIRHKAIIQYTHPFISVDLHTMASAFKTGVAGLEKELEALITDNQIQVR